MADRKHLVMALTGGLLTILMAAGLSPASARPERPAPVGSDPFTAGQPYHGDFPDPTVWRVGRRYYAAATTVAALNLPVITSTDLRTWRTRPSSNPARSGLNDAMPSPPSWTSNRRAASGRTFTSMWAPSVARIGRSYVAAYSAPRVSDGRRCISLARSSSPMGPYVDSSHRPLTCGVGGVIDPQIFVDRGKVLMTYKMKGYRGPIMIRRLNGHATGFTAGGRNYVLLTPHEAWEGTVVENPAMIRYRKRLYLFYSGNSFATSRYATGYAVCKSIIGPCKRTARLLASGTHLSGPGGATPFLDSKGRLRLAFHAWRTGSVGYPSTDSCLGTAQGCAQRRMYVAYLTAARRGRLVLRNVR